MIVSSVTAHGGGAATPQLSGPHSPARAGGKLIIIIVDNNNREQFIIAPLLPDCVSTSRVAGPDTIIKWWGVRRERGGALWGRKGGKGVGEARTNALLMVFIQAWRLQARPPHWQLGVNFPLLGPPITHL